MKNLYLKLQHIIINNNNIIIFWLWYLIVNMTYVQMRTGDITIILLTFIYTIGLCYISV